MTRLDALPWQHSVIDRGSERRIEDGFLARLAANPRTAYLLVREGKTLVHDGQIYLASAAIPGALAVYLGRTENGTELVALDLPAADQSVEELSDAEAFGAPENSRWLGFRQVGMDLTADRSQHFIEALAILNWHRVHTHCPRCGSVTVLEAAGWVRRCPNENSEHYPRTDPAIIVTVVDRDDRLLPGNGATWEPHRFSTLAGFVEPGESLAQAVVREIGEEVGVRVHTVDYLGSQPWPFPASLMLGFHAITDDTEAKPDGVEVASARWFSRDELQAAVLSGEIVISHRMSIARALIENLYGGLIQEPLSKTDG